MPRTPDRAPGDREETAIVFYEQTSDPSDDRQLSFVQYKGLMINSDGSPRSVAEGRASHHQKPVDDRDVNDPPGSPSAGDRVIVGPSPSGAFVGHSREIAEWTGSAWVFTTPLEGMLVYVKDEKEPYKQIESSSPWVWDRIYAEKHRNKNDAEGSSNSSSWLVHVRLPVSGTINLATGNYEILATILAYGTNPACEVGLRLRMDDTTTICENTVLPDVTGDSKQPCIARDWLDGLSGEHYFTVEFNKTGGAGVANVSHSRVSLQRLENG